MIQIPSVPEEPRELRPTAPKLENSSQGGLAREAPPESIPRSRHPLRGAFGADLPLG